MDWFSGGSEPLNPFESSRRELSRSNSFKPQGIGPVKLLCERSSTCRLKSRRIEGGKELEKLFWSKNKDLRLTSRERSGIGPESELLVRVKTRSWLRRVKVSGANSPRRPKPWRMRWTTLPCAHFTPCH